MVWRLCHRFMIGQTASLNWRTTAIVEEFEEVRHGGKPPQRITNRILPFHRECDSLFYFSWGDRIQSWRTNSNCNGYGARSREAQRRWLSCRNRIQKILNEAEYNLFALARCKRNRGVVCCSKFIGWTESEGHRMDLSRGESITLNSKAVWGIHLRQHSTAEFCKTICSFVGIRVEKTWRSLQKWMKDICHWFFSFESTANVDLLSITIRMMLWTF